MKRIEILGVPIDAVTMHEALTRTLAMLADGGKHHIMTPNNEMVLCAQKNSAFLTVLKKSELNIPDSTGLLWAAKHKGEVLPERVTGVDFTEKLCRRLSKEQSVFFLGGYKNAGKKAAEALQKLSPNLVIAGTYEGSPSAADAPEIIKRINDSGATLLLVAYGAPAQDLWINENILNLVSVRVAVGIGGTFDFLAGRIIRAPKWMQRSGLEWLFRFVQQPSRIGRMWNAVIIFPVKILRSK
jgi:N-acetylglucosaminyldiphosphoundecaprenol N-acetyl-beta-D-mannosaminyltransferase